MSSSSGNIIQLMMPISYISLITIGIILLFATIGSKSIDGLNGTIAGYSLILAGILLLVSLLFLDISMKTNSIMTYIYSLGPFLIILGIISYTIYLIVTYKNRIVGGNVAPGYVSFSNISIILILVQLFIFYTGTKQKDFAINYRLNKVYSMMLYFIGILNIVTIITLNIILKYYSTDG